MAFIEASLRLILKFLMWQVSSEVGALLATRAKSSGIEAVSWDRQHGQRFHGRIAELLKAMQNGGVQLN